MPPMTPIADYKTNKTFGTKILLYGEPKTGKTHFLGTYTKGPILVWTFDPNGAQTLRKFSDRAISVAEYSDANLAKPTAWKAFSDDLQAAASDGTFETLAAQNGVACFESCTTMADSIMDHVQTQSGKSLYSASGIREQATQPQWGSGMNIMKAFLRSVTSLPCAVVVTAHARSDKDEVTGKIIGFPTTVGKTLGPQQGIYFDEMYYLQILGGKRIFNTFGTGIFPAGTRYDIESKAENLTLDRVYAAAMK